LANLVGEGVGKMALLGPRKKILNSLLGGCWPAHLGMFGMRKKEGLADGILFFFKNQNPCFSLKRQKTGFFETKENKTKRRGY